MTSKLGSLSHDINGSLGTMALEVHSLLGLLERLRPRMAGEDARTIAELIDIAHNMAAATAQLGASVAKLASLAEEDG